VDALIGSVIELGELTGTPTPATRAVYALLKLLVKTMHDQSARVAMQALSARMAPGAAQVTADAKAE
jgi:2-dehydropantoate 2-reductase